MLGLGLTIPEVALRVLRLAASWPNGADGALFIDGETQTILAGSVMDYSSINIINGGVLEIVNNFDTGNGGQIPTIIGCKGNCVITTGGVIRAIQMVFPISTPDTGDYTFTNPSPPAGILVTPISFTSTLHAGGAYGGKTTLYGHGVGGEGGGLGGGGDVTTGEGWGLTGPGGEGTQPGGPTPGIDARDGGFGIDGHRGEDAVGFGTQSGAGGSGATRGYAGGCFYLQVNGALALDGVGLIAYGQNGGRGGDGGVAQASAGDANGGSAGCGAAGGDGGKIIVRYHAGFCDDSNCSTYGGTGGPGGTGGSASGGIMNSPGTDGLPGEDANGGSTDIASF